MMSDPCPRFSGIEDPPLTVLPQATDALAWTLHLTSEEMDPHVLEDRARAIATPVVVSELRRLAHEFLDEHTRIADDLNDRVERSARGGESLDPAEQRLRHELSEAVRLAASRLAQRARNLNEQAGDA